MAFSLGSNQSSSGGGFDSSVWGPQGSALHNLYNSAAQQYGQDSAGYQNPINQQASMAGQVATDAIGQSQGYMQDAYNRGSAMQNAGFNTGQYGANQMLGGGSIGGSQDIRQSLMDNLNQPLGRSNVGSMYESIVGGAGNEYIDPMVAAMKRSAGDNLSTMQNQNAMQAAAMGQSGGSRHAMQNAMESAAINQQVLDKEMNMRGGAYDKDLGMKMDIARQADSNMLSDRQNTRSTLMNMLGQRDQNIQSGMNFGKDAFNMGQNTMSGGGQFGDNYGRASQNLGLGAMSPYIQAQQSSFAPLQQYANVIGGPTILGSGVTSSNSKGFGNSGGLKG